jgi:hypothetical protein
VRDLRSRPDLVAVVAILLLALAGCQSTGSSSPPLPLSYEPVGELTGTWRGTWAGTPMTLVIAEYTEDAPYSGLYFGPWLIAGGRYPGVSGILTYARAGSSISTRFKGWIHSSRPLALLVAAEPLDGRIHARLRGAGPGTLTGEGESEFYWGPRGSIELSRSR